MKKSNKTMTPSARRPLNGTESQRIPGWKTKLKVGTWNVRGLVRPDKIHNVVQEMKSLNIDILGVSDVRWRGRGKRQDDNFVMYFNGSDETSNL